MFFCTHYFIQEKLHSIGFEYPVIFPSVSIEIDQFFPFNLSIITVFLAAHIF